MIVRIIFINYTEEEQTHMKFLHVFNTYYIKKLLYY